MNRHSVIVALVAGLVSAATPLEAQAQRGAPRGPFLVLVRTNPPPDDPNEWVIIVPASSNIQPLLGSGYQPLVPGGSTVPTYAEAASRADNHVQQNFPSSCRRAYNVFWNPSTRERVMVEDFAQKPYGFHLQQGGLCYITARAIIGQPLVYRSKKNPGTSVVYTTKGWTKGPRVQPPPLIAGNASQALRTPPAPAAPPPTQIGPAAHPPTNNTVNGLAVLGAIAQGLAAGMSQQPVRTQPQAQTWAQQPQAVRQPVAAQPQPQAWSQPQAQAPAQPTWQTFGPFSANTENWTSTGVSLQQGQEYKVQASGTFKSKAGDTYGPNGGGYWRWHSLKGRIGGKVIELGSGGGGTAPASGVLEIGIPRGETFMDAGNFTGGLTVYVSTKR